MNVYRALCAVFVQCCSKTICNYKTDEAIIRWVLQESVSLELLVPFQLCLPQRSCVSAELFHAPDCFLPGRRPADPLVLTPVLFHHPIQTLVQRGLRDSFPHIQGVQGQGERILRGEEGERLGVERVCSRPHRAHAVPGYLLSF